MIVTAAATCATVTVAVPDLLATVPVMVTVPFATAVTRPLGLTVAIALLDELQLAVWPATGLPLASVGAAVSWAVAPNEAMLVVGGVTVTALTTWATLTVAVPDLPPALPVMVTGPPLATAVTRPVVLTVATEVFDDGPGHGTAR